MVVAAAQHRRRRWRGSQRGRHGRVGRAQAWESAWEARACWRAQAWESAPTPGGRPRLRPELLPGGRAVAVHVRFEERILAVRAKVPELRVPAGVDAGVARGRLQLRRGLALGPGDPPIPDSDGYHVGVPVAEDSALTIKPDQPAYLCSAQRGADGLAAADGAVVVPDQPAYTAVAA